MKTAYSGNSGSQDMDRKALGLSDPSILETTVSHEPFKVPLLDVPLEVWGHLHGRSEKAELLRSSDSGTVLCLVRIRVLEKRRCYGYLK